MINNLGVTLQTITFEGADYSNHLFVNAEAGTGDALITTDLTPSHATPQTDRPPVLASVPAAHTGPTLTAGGDGHGGTTVVSPSKGQTSAHPFIAAMATLVGGGADAHVASDAHFDRPTMLATPRVAIN